jgi:hypothetical protein
VASGQTNQRKAIPNEIEKTEKSLVASFINLLTYGFLLHVPSSEGKNMLFVLFLGSVLATSCVYSLLQLTKNKLPPAHVMRPTIALVPACGTVTVIVTRRDLSSLLYKGSVIARNC